MCKGMRNVAGSVGHPSLVATLCPAAPYPGQPGVVGVGMSERQVLDTRKRSTGPQPDPAVSCQEGFPWFRSAVSSICPLPQDTPVLTAMCVRRTGLDPSESGTQQDPAIDNTGLSSVLLVPAGPTGTENRPIPSQETHRQRVQLPGRHKAKQTSWPTLTS